MEFLSVRDFGATPSTMWRKLEKDGKMVITNKGKPAALLLDLTNTDLEEMLEELRIAKAKSAFRNMRAEAAKRGFLSDDEINSEIKSVRREMNARKSAL